MYIIKLAMPYFLIAHNYSQQQKSIRRGQGLIPEVQQPNWRGTKHLGQQLSADVHRTCRETATYAELHPVLCEPSRFKMKH